MSAGLHQSSVKLKNQEAITFNRNYTLTRILKDDLLF